VKPVLPAAGPAKPAGNPERNERNMHLVKLCVFGITLATVVPGLHGQNKPAMGEHEFSDAGAAKATSSSCEPR